MDLFDLAHECAPQVAPVTMVAIVRTESGGNPWRIGVNGAGHLDRQPATSAQAVMMASTLIKQGVSVDLGLSQVNSNNLQRLGLSVEQVFDPCINLAAGAKLLTNNYQHAVGVSVDPQQALRRALSAYNTGSFQHGFHNGYVERVVRNAALPGVIGPSSQSATSVNPHPVLKSQPLVLSPQKSGGENFPRHDNINVYQAVNPQSLVFRPN